MEWCHFATYLSNDPRMWYLSNRFA